ncbi:hypothetical protein ABKY47_003666 [Aeromonas hydrophila]
MRLSEIINVHDVEDLKSLGTYSELKNAIEANIGSKLGVKGWNSLYEKIVFLKSAVSLLEKETAIYEGRKFSEAKTYLSKHLGINVKARGWKTLKTKVSVLIQLFKSDSFDPYAHYEKRKLKNFRDSSKLEGIVVDYPEKATSLDSILAKYKR